MSNRDLDAAEGRPHGDRIRDARREARLARRVRRHVFWTDLADSLLSMPAGIGMRLGG